MIKWMNSVKNNVMNKYIDLGNRGWRKVFWGFIYF